MIFPWALYAIAISFILGLTALLVERLLGGYGWPLRKLWSVCLLLSWLTPLALAVLPQSVEPETAQFASDPREATEPAVPATRIQPNIRTTVLSATDRVADFSLLFIAGWGIATAILLARQGLLLRRLSCDGRGRPRTELDGIEVIRSLERGPATIGVLRPRIVMPEWMETLSDPIRRLAFAHELEHVRSHDTRRVFAGWIACATVPWNPALWWQLKRLRTAIELDCDRRVLRAGASIADYGDLLIVVSRQRAPAGNAAVALFESVTEVERRLRFMTRRPPRRLALRLSGFALVVSGITMAWAQAPVPDSPIRFQPVSFVGEGDSASVELIFPRPPGRCVSGCYEEDLDRLLARYDLERGTCATEVRIMIDRQGRPGTVDLVKEDLDPRCNEAALEWAKETKWTPALEGRYGIVRLFGIPNQRDLTDQPEAVALAVSQVGPPMDRRTPALLVTADPSFDLDATHLAGWENLRSYESWQVQRRVTSANVALCALGRSEDDQLVLGMIERQAEEFLGHDLSGPEIESRLREFLPIVELYAAGLLRDGGACLLLLPGRSTPQESRMLRVYTVEHHPRFHLLLVHPDPGLTLEALLEGYEGLHVSLVAEAHRLERFLCTAGRTSRGEILLRTVPASNIAALAAADYEIGSVRIAQIGAQVHPDLEWLAGDVLQEGGSCFLVRSEPDPE